MKQIRLFPNVLLTTLLPCAFLVTNGQTDQLSKADSALFKRYNDSAYSVSPFSARHQRYLDSALILSPHSAYLWQQKAMPLYKKKKYEAGAPFLDSAVKYDASRYIDYRGFMKCIFQKRMHEAIADFHTAQQIIGKGVVMDHSYDFYIGLCYLQLNQLDSAEYFITKSVEDQRKALGANWIHYLDLFYLGLVQYEQEDYAGAISTLDKCLGLYKNFSDAKYYKAICLKRLGRSDEALAVMKEAEQDFKGGYTLTEDNAIHETYPYQIIKLSSYTGMVEYFESGK